MNESSQRNSEMENPDTIFHNCKKWELKLNLFRKRKNFNKFLINFTISIILLFFVILPSSAMETKEFVIQLTDENEGIITVTFKLSEREYNLIKEDTPENILRLTDEFGVNEERIGSFSFIQPGLTYWEDTTVGRVMRLPGFYFDRYTWANMDWFFNSAKWKLVSTDFSPAVVRVIWPDNYEVVFEDVTYIPNMEHAINSDAQ